MNSDELKPKWAVIENLPREGDYDLIRISSECYSEISLAISPLSLRCLILALPNGYHMDFHAVERERLSLTMVPDRNYVAMTLHDPAFVDLFDDLIVSMHNAIKDIEGTEEYSSVFIQTFHKWSRFFEPVDNDRLPDSIIQGLFGELIFLRKLLKEAPASQVNNLLEAWRGPYDQGNDFVFEDRDIEVKTRTLSNSSVRIANEDQLDQREAKGLELLVVTVERDGIDSQSLGQLTLEIAKIVEDALGDLTIFYTALLQKNLGAHNLADYDNITLKAHELFRFDCLVESFPRIVRSELSDAVFGLMYSLNTAELDDYLIEQADV